VGGGVGGGAAPTLPSVPAPAPVVAPVPVITPVTPAVSEVAPMPKPVIVIVPLVTDPLKFDELLANLGTVSKPDWFEKNKALVKASAAEFKVAITDEQTRAITNFITYGVSRATEKLGAGERNALVRDYFETIGRGEFVWDDIQKITTGQKPVKRNLPKEQANADRALKSFILMTGHAPNFKVPAEDLAWNTLMYRIRFPRDLVKEREGILKYKKLYKKDPKTPFDWSVVRALGYALK
jgi:hypothetical protein